MKLRDDRPDAPAKVTLRRGDAHFLVPYWWRMEHVAATAEQCKIAEDAAREADKLLGPWIRWR